MTSRNSKRVAPPEIPPKAVMPAKEAYVRSMTLIRSRFLSLDSLSEEEASLLRAEKVALHVRKIIEGVAFGALSACEIRNTHQLREQRTKDADKLLEWLHQRKMLRLPDAQRVQASDTPEIKCKLNGANGANNVGLDELKDAYSHASALIHERHPERIDQKSVQAEADRLAIYAQKLRAWLWLHIMFLKGGEAVLIQMGQFGTSSFCVSLSKEEAPVASDTV